MKHFAELFVKGVEEGGHAERQLVKCDRGYEPELENVTDMTDISV